VAGRRCDRQACAAVDQARSGRADEPHGRDGAYVWAAGLAWLLSRRDDQGVSSCSVGVCQAERVSTM